MGRMALGFATAAALAGMISGIACGSSSDEGAATTGATTTATTGADGATTSTSSTGSSTSTTGAGGAGLGGAGGSVGGSGGVGGAGGAKGPGPGESCDPVAQDCADPAASKCEIDYATQPELPAKCVAPLGDAKAGEACTRPTNQAGIDTCADAYCSMIEHPRADPQERSCRSFCNSNAMCGDGAFCSRLNVPKGGVNAPMPPGVRMLGLCVKQCDLWAPDPCAPDTRCVPVYDVENTQGKTLCIGYGKAQQGDACSAPEDCDLGLMCFGQVCQPDCNDKHPTCPNGMTCAANGAAIGMCKPL